MNERGEEFIPVGNTLHCIKKIDLSELDQRIKETEILVMCDVSTFCAEQTEQLQYLDHRRG